MTLREKIETMQAFERGEEIEVSYVKQDKWTDVYNPDWSWGAYNYRIKPKSKKTITIEKWLCKDYTGAFLTLEGDDRKFATLLVTKVKLLDTYEIKLP